MQLLDVAAFGLGLNSNIRIDLFFYVRIKLSVVLSVLQTYPPTNRYLQRHGIKDCPTRKKSLIENSKLKLSTKVQLCMASPNQ